MQGARRNVHPGRSGPQETAGGKAAAKRIGGEAGPTDKDGSPSLAQRWARTTGARAARQRALHSNLPPSPRPLLTGDGLELWVHCGLPVMTHCIGPAPQRALRVA
jgi:hypothetical protein